MCYDKEEAKELVKRFKDEISVRKDHCYDLKKELDARKDESNALLKELQEKLRAGENLDLTSKLDDLGIEQQKFIVNLNANKCPKAIPHINEKEINKSFSDLRDHIRRMDLTNAELKSLLHFPSKDSLHITNILDPLKQSVNEYLFSKLPSIQSQSEESFVVKEVEEELTVMLSMYAVYKARLSKVKHELDGVARRYDHSEVSSKVHIEDFDVGAIELEAVRSKKKEYEEANEKLEQTTEKLTREVTDLKDKSKALSTEIKNKAATLEEKDRLIAEIEAKKREQEEINEQHRRMSDKVVALSHLKDSLEKEVGSLRLEEKELEKQCENRESSLQANEKMYKELVRKTEAKGEELKKLKKKFKSLIEVNKKEVEEMKEKLITLKSTLDRNRKTIRDKVRKKKEKLRVLNANFIALKDKHEGLAASVKALNEAIQEAKTNATNLNKSLQEKQSIFENQIRLYKNNLKESKKENTKLTQQKDELSKELSKIERSISENKDMLNPRVILQYSVAEEAKVSTVGVGKKSDPKLVQLLAESINLQRKINPQLFLSPELNKKMPMKYISFVNFFADTKSFLQLLEASLKASYNDIYVENGERIVDRSVFEKLEAMSLKLEENAKLCMKLKGEGELEVLKREADEFNRRKGKLTVILI